MKDKTFIDTNIIVYSFDQSAPHKQEKAGKIIHEALISQRGCISYQVAQEFLNLSTTKFKTLISHEHAKEYYFSYLHTLMEIFPNHQLFFTAIDISRDTKYSFYDSLIIAAAIQSGAKQLLSEDLQHGQVISGVRIINPFLDLQA